MVCLTFDSLTHEWLIRYQIDGVAQQSVRTGDNALMRTMVNEFAALEKGLALGKSYYVVKGAA